MYGILIKYKSTSNKTFWYDYEVEKEDGTTAPFLTSDKALLEAEIAKLDKEIGFSNIKIIDDITYSVGVEITEIDINNIEIATLQDVENVYNTAFSEVFGEGGN